MKRISTGRNIWVALALAGVVAAPVGAQEAGERYTILVPNLAPQNGVSDRFGKEISKELRRLISDLHTHQTVSDRDLRTAMRKYNVSEQQLYNCVTARQLAMQEGWQLVVCGDYQPAGSGQVEVDVQFVGAHNAEEFEVPEFTAGERQGRQAAQEVLQSFDRWQTQLRRTVFCKQYIDSQQWDSALENCEEALEINPRSETALYQRAYTLWKMDRKDEALTDLERLLELDPIDQDGLKLAGIIATEQGERERARGYFDRYMELNPGDVGVRLTIATEIANADDPEGALRFAQQGLEAEPDNINLLTYIGHFAANAAARAESRLSAGEAVDPEKVTEFYRTAAESYEKVFAEKGTETDAQILERLIVAQVKLERFDEAVRLGEQATQAQAENAAIWEAYARALEGSGDIPGAVRALERAEGLGAESASIVARKASLQLQQGNADAAIDVLREGVESGRVPAEQAFPIIFRVAYQDNFQKGRLDEAMRLLERAGPLAVTEEQKLTRNFWRGYILYQQAQKVAEPRNAEAARRAKPMFERALEMFQGARGYERIHASADVPKLIDATRQFIEIQEALIRRGR